MPAYFPYSRNLAIVCRITPVISSEIKQPQLYVDNKSRDRSGHTTHAMAEFAAGCFINFNSNCSAVHRNRHSPYGRVEYRISKDAGKTYSDIKTLPYSVDCFLDGLHMISVEKAVACDGGTIVAFCLRNSGTDPTCCELCKVKLGVRNPNIALIAGVNIFHGRSEDYEGLVLYTSEDACNWGEGTILVHNKGAAAFYSNNLNLKDEKGNFLLVQYSDRYVSEQFRTLYNCRVNVMHMNLRIRR